ncbi:MAG: triose-phosphate isomerase [Dehalococcoidia bacterium]|nr:MAG: triose-phosphate isomerase [Dehalococcoidia bacterium]
MRAPMIAGNWKMNTTLAEASALVMEMKEGLERIAGVEKVLCPPFLSLSLVKELLQGSSIKVGAQNMYFEEQGAYTGEISPLMLCGICEYVILGHSERRQYFGETDELVNRKVKAALAAGLTPILCVGERLEEKEAERTEEVVTRQVTGALQGIESLNGMVIAYEPVWAIGTGRAATGKGANATIGIIRETVAQLYSKGIAQGIRILYGGSVTAANIAEFIGQHEIDGALVGGASLKAKEFLTIVEQTAAIKK